MSKTNFTHLHVHTEFSSLDGAATIPIYVARAKKLGMPALAITDHGNIAGSHEFYTECRAQEIEPILGCEYYFVRDAQAVKEDKQAERFHITFLAQDEAGFEILTELSSASHRNYYYKPLIDVPLLEGLSKKDRSKLVVLSGCAGSIISRSLMGGIEDDAHEWLRWWKKQFPNFYIELMHHKTSFDKELNGKLIKAAKRHELEWVITNDPHFVMKEEACHHDALLAIQTAAKLDDPNRFRFEGEGYHLKSPKEMEKTFRKYGDEIFVPGAANTVKIAKGCHTRIKAWDSRSWHIPKFPGVKDADVELRRLAELGMKTLKLDPKISEKKYIKRMNRELDAFKAVPGMANFLLINADICAEARRRGIRMGPGRGSVCGTLVGYLIRIHKVDSVKYDLLFERFLNPDRPKMPDIDHDFQASRRPEMFEYTEQKYGKENVMRVGAYQRMKMKKTFKSLAMTYGIPFQTSNALSKSIIEDEEGNAFFATTKGAAPIEKVYPELYASLQALIGLKVGVARHAAGVIIFDPNDPIRRLVPEMRISDESGIRKTIDYVSQFDLVAAGDIGLMKQDFLGLRTLDTIQECVDLIKARHGVVVEPDDWTPGEEKGDNKVWKLLRDGHTPGVFQMEGGANHRGIQEIKCEDFESIVACTSLYRAGPMIAGAPKRYLKNKKDKKIRVAHKSIESYMANSWGEMIYQEQMFQMLNEAAGLSWAQVDDVKTAMARKDPVKMAAMKDVSVAGFQKVSGMSEEKATEIWNQIQAQAAYLFNRCATGDTLVYRSNFTTTSGQTISLADLYRIWKEGALRNQQERSLRSAYRRRGLSIKAYKDGAIKRAKVKNIYCNGIKPVFKTTLANGMFIKTTGNHCHLAEQGWVRTDELLVGQSLVVDSGRYASPSKNGAHINGAGTDWAGKTFERRLASDGRMRPSLGGHAANLSAVTALLPNLCEHCGETEGRLERAHLDGDRTNNSRENVLRLCNSCHKQHDWDTGQRVRQYAHGYFAELSEIVSIESVGEEMTYDLEMDDPSHNFVANGIVTHNSHAVAYSITTYQTARLMLLYPLEFLAALLRTVVGSSDMVKDKRESYMNEALRREFKILPPDVNVSDDRFMPNNKDELLFGLTDIKGVGFAAVKKLMTYRSQKKIERPEQVAFAVNNSGVMGALSASGALRSLGVDPDTNKQEELLRWAFQDHMRPFREKYAKRIALPGKAKDGRVSIIGEIRKVEKRTTKNDTTFFQWSIRHAPGEDFRIQIWDSASELFSLLPGSVVIVSGKWSPTYRSVGVSSSENVDVVRRITSKTMAKAKKEKERVA